MSKLAKHIAAHDTGRRHIEQTPIPSLQVMEEVSYSPVLLAKEYRVEARLGVVTMVSDMVEDRTGVWTDAIRHARCKLVEEVFGEFRPLIHQINEAIHMRDWQGASLLTGKLYDQMFVEGV